MIISKRLKNCINLLRRSHFHYYRMAMLQPPFWLRANGRTIRVAASNELGAGSCYAEVVIEDCYGLFKYSTHGQPRVIVDIGANFGIFSKLSSLLFPEADIYAYEPNPSAIEWLTQNAEGTRIRIIPCAVGEHTGIVKLDASCDSTIGRIAENGTTTVNCIAASEVAEGREIDVLKMDCEGSEWSILKETTLLNRSREFILEYHLVDGHTIEELKELIAKTNHRITNWIENRPSGQSGLLRSKHNTL